MDQRETAAAALFDAIQAVFSDDEGSLPEVQIDGIAPSEAQELFALAAPLQSGQTVWDEERDEEVSIRDFTEPGRLAAKGRLSSLHFVLRELRWGDGELPELGVSVWPGTLALDYSPGAEWTVNVVARFVRLLRSSEGPERNSAQLSAA